jgi:hypothetical protein
MPDQDQLKLGLFAAACLVLLAMLWRFRRSRSGKKSRVTAPATEPALTSAASVSDFTTLYDEALATPEPTDPPVAAALSEYDQAGQDQAPGPTPIEDGAEDRRPAPVRGTATSAAVLNDFRKALDDGMDLLDAARKYGLTEDEARVAAICYSPPDA